jgi:probable rRNA maturation factor
VILTITAATGKAYVPFLRNHLKKAHELLGKKSALREMSLALVGDRAMSALHERFMQIAGPTDVLTFPLEVDRRGRTISGEVVVDVAEARRRGKSEQVAPKLELLLYALHGMLHLVGYDDRTEREYRTMHLMEDRLLTKLGVGPLFDRTSGR